VTGLTYVIKNVVPHLVDLLGSFNLNALEKKVEKEVVAVATTYWTSCLAFLPAVFRGQIAVVAAAAAPELVKKAEEVVAEAVKKVEAVAGPEAAAAVSAVVEAVENKVEAVVEPEKVEVVLDAVAKVPDWSAPVDLSGAAVTATESSNPV
jgi:methionyl-tRNA synthetase